MQKLAKTVYVALESISSDSLQQHTLQLEQELHTLGLPVQTLEFPTSKAEVYAQALVDSPELLQNPRAVGLAAILDRRKSILAVTTELKEPHIILCSGGPLATQAWLSGLYAEASERIELHKWLDDFEYAVLGNTRLDLTLFLDVLPEHLSANETVLPPVGWGTQPIPNADSLRSAYIEASHIAPKTKVVTCYNGHLQKPDLTIHNEIWNLVRRIALKTNLPPEHAHI